MKDNLSNIPELNLDKTEHFYVVGTKNRDGVLAGNYKVDIKKGSGSDDNTSVLRTTAQTLTYEQQEMALSNLGLYPLAGIPEENRFNCDWGFNCETHLLDANTLTAIKQVPDGEMSEDSTFRYILMSSDVTSYCIVSYKHTENGKIYIEVWPHKPYIPQHFSLEETNVFYEIDENTGEITDYHVYLTDGNAAINEALLVKNSVIDLHVKRYTNTVTGIQVYYGGAVCIYFGPAMFFTLMNSTLSFTGKVYKHGYNFNYEEFKYYRGSSGGAWQSTFGKSMIVNSETDTLEVYLTSIVDES